MKFENEQDIERERSIIKRFCERFDLQYTKLPDWELDYLLHKDGTAQSFAEVKGVNLNIAELQYKILSLTKLKKLLRASEYLRSVLILGFYDKIAYLKAENIKGKIQYRGRKDREGGVNDMEWVISIQMNLFKTI